MVKIRTIKSITSNILVFKMACYHRRNEFLETLNLKLHCPEYKSNKVRFGLPQNLRAYESMVYG
jgi:hypothetical protein